MPRQASREPDVEQIVVANMPFRVHGASVGGDFTAALGILGERATEVRAALWVSNARPDDDGLAGEGDDPIRITPAGAEVRVRVNRGPFARVVGPRPPAGESG